MHIPVLLRETLKLLDPKNNEIIVDATINGGGFTEEIFKIKNFKGVVIGIDQDESLINDLRERFGGLEKMRRLKLINGNFRDIDEYLKQSGTDKINGALFDLGMSSRQLEGSGRGFSFLRDEPLLMTYKANPAPQDITAEKIINDWSEKDIIKILKVYGEERFVLRIMRCVAETRKKKRIKTTFELVKVIEKAIPAFARASAGRKTKIHPATKTFQALRIVVNDELNVLKEGLDKTFKALSAGGRLVVISFHSLEDRIVKNFFRDLKNEGKAEVLTKKPITATDEEIRLNPRSRSAKLRTIIKK